MRSLFLCRGLRKHQQGAIISARRVEQTSANNDIIRGGYTMRVQFSVNDEELKRLESYAKEAGYPDISSYCKDEVLRLRTYAELWNKVTTKISEMEKGKTFALRDLIDTPPSNLGVKLYNHQVELGIEVNDKDRTGANTFTKL